MDYEQIRDRVFSGTGLGYALLSQAAGEDPEVTVSDLNQYSGIFGFRGLEVLALGFWRHEAALGSAWVDDKFLTAKTLRKHGLPAPRSVCVTTSKELQEAINNIPFPVVVKPRNGSRGRGVTVNVDNFEDLYSAFQIAAAFSNAVVIEEYIDIADELRILASDDRCYGVVRRTLPTVSGDGVHDISDLIDIKNQERMKNPAVHDKLIPKDSTVEKTLSSQGRTLSSVPKKGEEIIVRNVGGLSSGGDSQDYTAQTPTYIHDLSTQMVRSIPGLHWAGIDVAIERNTGRPWIIEANINAGYSFEFPSTGDRRDITTDLWKHRKADALARARTYQEVEDRFSPNNKKTNTRLEHAVYLENARSRRISMLYRTFLTGQGFEITQISPSVFEVYKEDELQFRYTRSFRTGDDLAIVNRFLKSHALVREILKFKDIPRPRGQRPADRRILKSRVPSLGNKFLAISARAAWGSPRSRIITRRSPLFESSALSSFYLQAVVEGVRFRVIANRNRTFCVLSKDADASRLLDSHSSHLKEIAVRAVRAVPELRWASVDLVIRKNPTKNLVLVEGLTINPILSSKYSILDGSFQSFFEWFTDYALFTKA